MVIYPTFIVVSAYLKFVDKALRMNNKAILIVPILPTNIDTIIISLPAVVKCGVIPVDNPTVPIADTSSKRSERNDLSGSVMLRKKMEPKMTLSENNAIE